MDRAIGLAGALAVILLAGCIEVPDDPAQPERATATGGSMSAAESRTEKSEVCTDGLDLAGDRFCAERVVSVTGTVAGFERLDVALETFNGAVSVTGSSGSGWKLTATLRARGATADEAMARVYGIDFAWAHEDASGHFVEAIARHEGDSETRSVALALTMPRDLALRLTAATSNGGVSAEGVRTDGLALTTSNGGVDVDAAVTQVALTTSNGKIEGELRPTGDGRWAITTSNGGIALKVPESAGVGYSFQGTTSNGEVDYTLRDGEKGACPTGSEYYTPPCNHRTFESGGFRSRDTQVTGTLTTSNGKISVAPS